jgi:hypothetical protein
VRILRSGMTTSRRDRRWAGRRAPPPGENSTASLRSGTAGSVGAGIRRAGPVRLRQRLAAEGAAETGGNGSGGAGVVAPDRNGNGHCLRRRQPRKHTPKRRGYRPAWPRASGGAGLRAVLWELLRRAGTRHEVAGERVKNSPRVRGRPAIAGATHGVDPRHASARVAAAVAAVRRCRSGPTHPSPPRRCRFRLLRCRFRGKRLSFAAIVRRRDATAVTTRRMPARGPPAGPRRLRRRRRSGPGRRRDPWRRVDRAPRRRAS